MNKTYVIKIARAFIGVSRERVMFISATIQIMDTNTAKAVIEKLKEFNITPDIEEVTTTHEFKSVDEIYDGKRLEVQ